MTTISVCMIVKNESAVLARCLDSLSDIPDEIIIVDTGSIDDTKAIARKYTNKLYDFEWQNNFAAARNFALSKAKSEYIYTADADEVIDEENIARFRLLKKALFNEIEMVEMAYADQLSHNTTANFEIEYRPKLFLRLRPFLFMDPIHEILRTEPIVFRSDVVVQHRPTGGHGQRDLNILARVAAKGELLSDRLEMMYARELFIAGTMEDFKAARTYFETALDAESSSADSLRRAACVLSRDAALAHDEKRLLRFAAPGLVGMPPSEICCSLADYYFAQEDIEMAVSWYNAALGSSTPELVAASAGQIALEGLAACCKALGDTNAARDYMKQAKAWRPEHLLEKR